MEDDLEVLSSIREGYGNWVGCLQILNPLAGVFTEGFRNSFQEDSVGRKHASMLRVNPLPNPDELFTE
jgi:hypothetical protein